jgi:hypothetical protein
VFEGARDLEGWERRIPRLVRVDAAVTVSDATLALAPARMVI